MPTAEETRLSPDGKSLATTYNGQIALMPAGGGWPTQLTSTAGAKSGFTWSSDSKQLTYVSQGSIWVVSIAGGAPRQLTSAKLRPGDPPQSTDRFPQWSPKGRWILFVSGRRGSNDLMVVSEDGTVTRFLTAAGADNGIARWSPDGTKIAYIERTEEHFSGSVRVIDFDSQSGQPLSPIRTLYVSPVDRGGGWAIRHLAWSPDGKQLATVLQNTGWNHLYLLAAGGGDPKQITDGAFNDGNSYGGKDVAFSPDGTSLAFISTRGGLLEANNLWVMASQGGDAHQVARFDGPGITTDLEWAPDGRHLYFHRETPVQSSDLFIAEVDGSKPQQLTATTPRNFSAAVMPERITWKSKDGREIAGMLYTPRGQHPKGSLPAVVWVHGGPEGQDNFSGDTWAQYLASAGYVVLQPNYRGSEGYGEVFRNLNVEDSGGLEVDDVAYGAKVLVKRGLVDPKRMAIGGFSHGGTITAFMVVRYPELFAAAIDFAGVVDRALFVEQVKSIYPLNAFRWEMKMGGTPAEKPDNYRRANVFYSVDQIKTPLLILHAENDPTLALASSFAKAIKEHHKKVYFFTYPNELHGVSQPGSRLDSWEKELAFLEHYINPQAGVTSSATEDVVFPHQPGMPALPK
jgi:dipeptidyl aminopeptidase/acylaminoacyl peptidase